MAIALDSTTGWCLDADFDDSVTSTSFSPGANTFIVVAVQSFSHRPSPFEPIFSNTGTSLTWTKVEVPGAHTEGVATSYLYYAKNASSQSSITVTCNDSNGVTSLPSLNVYVFSGVDTTSPVASSFTTTSVSGTNTSWSSGTNTSNANAWVVFTAKDKGFNGSLSSSDTTEVVDTFQSAMSGYRSYTSSGTAMSINLTRGGSTDTWQGAALELKPAVTGTTHNADAALSSTATLTATAAVTRFPAAALSTTSAVTATATRTQAGDAALSTTATITASADVIPAATYVDAALSTTATVTASATVSTTADAAVSTSVAVIAIATLTGSAAAALSTTSAIAATMFIEGDIPTTVGYMRGAEMSAATMRSPASSASGAPTIAALVSIDPATLTAVVSTAVTASRYGVSVFVGGSEDPITAGLLPEGSAYVWFASDGIHVQEAS